MIEDVSKENPVFKILTLDAILLGSEYPKGP